MGLGAKGGANGILSGASTGASIGSIIPGLGTTLGGAIGGGLGLIAGLFKGDDGLKDKQKLMQQAWEYEKEGMAMQYNYGQQAADAEYQRNLQMWKDTNFGAQRAEMEKAGLSGGSGSSGQAHGATVEPATAMQPMGLQVALQAQQVAAQTALTNAQAEKIRSETTKQKVENLIGVGVDLAKKVAEVRKSKFCLTMVLTLILVSLAPLSF